MSVSAVLITREQAWPVDALVDYPFAETLICTECPNIFRRFELAADAKFDTVYVQDDDIVIDVMRLYKKFVGRLTNNMPLGFQEIYEGTNVSMIGFGCFFPRHMAERFVERQQFWRDEFGDAIFEMEADRFFTYDNRPWDITSVPLRQINRPVKMSGRPGHYNTRTDIFTRLRAMGDRP